MTAAITEFLCQVCGCDSLENIREFSSLPRLTSDCRPFKCGGDLCVCMSCGGVQKLPTPEWVDEIGDIYGRYNAYEIAGGEEQIVLDPVSGQPRRRSDVLLDRLAASGHLPGVSSLLDVGCGGGVTLRSAATFFPTASLYGHELGSTKRDRLAQIPGFVDLYSGELLSIELSFDLLTMIHSLEHFVQPCSALAALRTKAVERSGRLFVEVCNVEENPFDLVVADHLLHLSPATLARMAARAGWQSVLIRTDWVRKEISFLARVGEGDPKPVLEGFPESVLRNVRQSVSWLQSLAAQATAVSSKGAPFGIFGTSVASTWLFSQMGDRVDFFVDEDPNRAGRRYMDRPVHLPIDVPKGSTVFIALAPTLAGLIVSRMNQYPFRSVGVANA